MSIIERALERLRHQNEKPNHAPRPTGRLRDAPAPAAPRPREARARAPSETIHADLGALRDAGLLPPAGSEERIREQFRRIKWPVLETALGRGQADSAAGNTVLVTSSLAGEGKSFVCFNLALSIGRERDVDVLLIDGDVAKRHLTRVLGTEARPGLVEIAADASLDPERLVLGTDIPGLSFLPSGQPTTLASELIASQRMAEAVASLRAADPRRIILFDSAPLLAANEARILATLMDQIVLVVCAESTPQPVVLEAAALLDHSKPVRCLLNQTRLHHLNEYYYHYGYGYPENGQARQP